MGMPLCSCVEVAVFPLLFSVISPSYFFFRERRIVPEFIGTDC